MCKVPRYLAFTSNTVPNIILTNVPKCRDILPFTLDGKLELNHLILLANNLVPSSVPVVLEWDISVLNLYTLFYVCGFNPHALLTFFN